MSHHVPVTGEAGPRLTTMHSAHAHTTRGFVSLFFFALQVGQGAQVTASAPAGRIKPSQHDAKVRFQRSLLLHHNFILAVIHK